MALRLVRQTSETPDITNKDDTIMTRYAYGGYNGVVKAFGNECGYTTENGIFKILDGRIVLDGWEIDIDGAGWSLNLSTVTGIQYHSVYVSANISIESVSILSTYLTGSYPEVDKGDDLTSAPNGTASLLLYNVKVENGAITEVVKRFEIIPYLTQKVLDIEKDTNDKIATIEERLDKLGFKMLPSSIFGSIYTTGAHSGSLGNFRVNRGNSDRTGTVREGNFVYLSLYISLSSFGTTQNIFTFFYDFYYKNQSASVQMSIAIPEEYRPKNTQTFFVYGRAYTTVMSTASSSINSGITTFIPIKVTVSKDGTVSLRTISSVSISHSATYLYAYSISAESFELRIGYEANPVE